MVKVDVSLTVYAEETMRIFDSCGCLLVSGKMDKANVMTIGWASLDVYGVSLSLWLLYVPRDIQIS